VANTGPGAAPISLAVAADVGGFILDDIATPAEVRVIHASPDAPAVDVIVNDDFANPVLANVPYPTFSGYLSLAPDTYNFKVTAAGNPGAIVIDADVDLEGRDSYAGRYEDCCDRACYCHAIRRGRLHCSGTRPAVVRLSV
jgi:hypothetical protein